MIETGAHSRPAGLREQYGGFQQGPPLTSTTLTVLSWSTPARLAEDGLPREANILLQGANEGHRQLAASLSIPASQTRSVPDGILGDGIKARSNFDNFLRLASTVKSVD
jgi:hypothetical protein